MAHCILPSCTFPPDIGGHPLDITVKPSPDGCSSLSGLDQACWWLQERFVNRRQVARRESAVDLEVCVFTIVNGQDSDEAAAVAGDWGTQ